VIRHSPDELGRQAQPSSSLAADLLDGIPALDVLLGADELEESVGAGQADVPRVA
jgi:hypothetical protein